MATSKERSMEQKIKVSGVSNVSTNETETRKEENPESKRSSEVTQLPIEVCYNDIYLSYESKKIQLHMHFSNRKIKFLRPRIKENLRLLDLNTIHHTKPHRCK